MGHTPTIHDLTQKNEEFKAYLDHLANDLKEKAKGDTAQVAAAREQFYKQSKIDDRLELLSGQSTEFQQIAELSFDNLKKIIDAISKAVFAGTEDPNYEANAAEAGAKVKQDTADKVKKTAEKAVGAGAASMEAFEGFIAGKVFDVISSVMTSFGGSISTNYTSEFKQESLGYGLQMFVSIAADSYRSNSFFNNDAIYEYRYTYEIWYSDAQAERESHVGLAKLYEDRLANFEKRAGELADQLGNGEIDGDAYERQSAVYDRLIADGRKNLAALHSAASA
ncbi:hypothetical protein [Yinghuangia sp. YIM S09857]|uniref:hypothetical protein n=1 Tax=Yinghuangia sp. YIM S09857 TaxID=3436929 RepID=UPI003F52E363